MPLRLAAFFVTALAASWLFSSISQADSGSEYRTDHVTAPAVATTISTTTSTTASVRVQYALDQVGHVSDGSTVPWTDTWSGYCDAFAVATVLAGEGDTTPLSLSDVFPNAVAHYNWSLDHGYVHTTSPPPPGALVFYDTGTSTGHVAVSVGNNQIVTTQGEPDDDYAVVTAPYTAISGYLGWSWY